MKLVKKTKAATYDDLLTDVAHVIEAARHDAARSVNAFMTFTYWLIGRRIIEQEQQGAARAGYGEELLKRLARDLSGRFGRGFSERNLEQMRAFYPGWPISQTVPAKLSDVSSGAIRSRFRLSWSHYALCRKGSCGCKICARGTPQQSARRRISNDAAARKPAGGANREDPAPA